MAIEIELYKKEYSLKESFITASGSLNKKEILILVYRSDSKKYFLYELPLSPRIGFSTSEVIEFFLKHRTVQYEEVHPLILRGLSFFEAFQTNFSDLPKGPSSRFEFLTHSIGSKHFTPEKTNQILKFKASPQSLSELAKMSRSFSFHWTVDFNASLTAEQFIEFCNLADLKFCYFIEQPLPVGKMNRSIASKVQTSIYADEELLKLSPNDFCETGYSGFLIKPIYFTYQQMREWMIYGRTNKLPFLMSTLVSDFVDQALVGLFSSFAPVDLGNHFSDFFVRADSLDKLKVFLSSDKGLSVNDLALKYVIDNYKKIDHIHLVNN